MIADSLMGSINGLMSVEEPVDYPHLYGKLKLSDLKLSDGCIITGKDLEWSLKEAGLSTDNFCLANLNLLKFSVDEFVGVYFLIPFYDNELPSALKILSSYKGQSLGEINYRGGKRLKEVIVDAYLFKPGEIHLVANTHDFRFKRKP